MADIFSINGVEVGSISSINGVDISTVNTINNCTVSITEDIETGVFATIDSSLVDEDLYLFPLGVQLDSSFSMLNGLGDTDWRYLHATVNGKECNVEVSTWDMTVPEAVIWVRVPVISSSVDTVIQVEITDELNDFFDQSWPISETFTANDGTELSGVYWAVGDDDIDFNIQSNALQASHTDIQATSRIFIPVLYGDFDIQIDYSIIADPVVASWYFQFGVYDIFAATTNYAEAQRMYDGTSSYASSIMVDSTLYTGSATTSDTTGQLRLVRVGTTLTTYYYDSDWVAIDTNASFTSNPVHLYMRSATTATMTFTAAFDNLIINSADTILGHVGETGDDAAKLVWDGNYVGVWHMSQDPSASDILDSTINGNDGTPNGSMTSDDLIDGGFGKAIELDGTDDYFVVADSDELGLDATKSMTLEGYINSYIASVSDLILDKRDTNYGYLLGFHSSNSLHCYTKDGTDTVEPSGSTTLTRDGSVYYHSAGIFDRSTDIAKVFLNGTQDSSDVDMSAIDDCSNSIPLYIGYRNPGLSSSWGYFYGAISEVRISDIVRSAAWIKTTAQNLLGNLVTLSEVHPTIRYATIDSTLIDSDLTNFPVGIKLTALDGILNNLSSTDWQYLHATVDGVECYMEVDVWDMDTRDAMLWVRVPTVSSSTDTTVTLELIPESKSATEITSATVYDDFVGDDGSDPDASLWVKDVVAGTDYFSIQSNALNYASNDSQRNVTRIVATYVLSGDFDIELDGLNIDTYVASSSGGTHAMMLKVTGFDGISIGIVSVYRGTSTLAYYSNGTNSGNFASDVSIPLADGKLRLTRTSGVVKAFYWDAGASQWEWSGSTSGRTVSSSNTSDAYIEIINIVAADCELSCSADQLTINSCDSLYLFSGPDMLDDFVADDDSDPDTSLWVKETTSGTDHLFIQSNKLSYISNEDQANVTTITSLFALTGDFDIELDGVDVDTFVASSSSGSHLAYMKAVTLSGTVLGSISVYRSSGTLAYFSGGINAGNFASDVSIPLADGKLRLTRVSGVIRSYYWDRVYGQWEWSGAITGRTLASGYSQDVMIVIGYEIGASANVSCTVDKFKINYCDYISQYVDQTAGWAAQQVWTNNFDCVYHLSSDATDASGTGNDGDLNGSPVFESDALCNYMHFDGVDDYILETLIYSGDFTVNFLYNRQVAVASLKTIVNNNTTGVGVVYIGAFPTNTLAIDYDTSTSDYVNPAYTTPLDDWAHISIVRSGTTLSLYVDGTLSESGTIVSDDVTFTHIGYRPTASDQHEYFLSQLTFDTEARSAAWIKATAQNLLGNLVTIS